MTLTAANAAASTGLIEVVTLPIRADVALIPLENN